MEPATPLHTMLKTEPEGIPQVGVAGVHQAKA
jgi:hypothetical protein